MSIRINVDPANPGQFFACCGLLELADRLWDGAEAAFSSSGVEFSLHTNRNSNTADPRELLAKLASCSITSTMTDEQITALKKLLNRKKIALTPEELAEKQRLSTLWEQERLHLDEPFNMCIDWWGDARAGGDSFKTWAGKQFVIDLVRGMQQPMRSGAWLSLISTKWLHETVRDGSLPLYFDADVGSQSSSRDAGFSTDALGMRGPTRPLIELAAFIGLQRFRPIPENGRNSFSYVQWTQLLPPEVAAAACCGRLPQPGAQTFEFRLLYRTKYLKSFLSARPRRLTNG